MKGLLYVIGMIVAMAVVLAIFTEYTPEGDATTLVLGMPVVSVRQEAAHGWLAIGQSATGVLVIAQAGGGVVAFVQVGVGLLFGIGQAMLSLVAFAQIGVGLFAYVGQIGLGAQAIGQGVVRRKSSEYFNELSDEISELLSWKGA